MMILDRILKDYPDDEFLKADGLDEAVIGLDEKHMRLIYSAEKCIDILSRNMSQEEATGYFYYNVAAAYMGKKTPIWYGL